MTAFSLSFLTTHGAPPETAIRVAARAGYDHVGLRLLPASPGGVAFPLMGERARLAALRRQLDDSGVGLLDLEIVRLAPDFSAERLLPFLEAGAILGAKALLVAGDDADEARLTASFAALCDAAAEFGLTADLEYMPQSALRDLSGALRVLAAAGKANQGVIVDALHTSRARVRAAEIAAIPRGWLHYAQICDAPAAIPDNIDALNHAARHERLLPGDGAIDLAAIFDALPADLPIAVEIPNDAQAAGVDPVEWARRALLASRNALKRLERTAP